MSHEPPPRARIPADVASLRDYERHAQAVLDEQAWAYFSGGAADELTLQDNVAAWSRWRLRSRVLQPLAGGHTRVTLGTQVLEHPIMLAPVAYQRMAHADGEIGTALAAAAQQAGLILSTQSSTSLEAVAQVVRDEPGRGPLWFQLYLQHDAAFNRALVARAEAAGYEALVLTVDAPVHGARDRERRAGFRLPAGIEAVNLKGLPPAPAAPSTGSAVFDGLLRHAPGWDDVQTLIAQTRLPVWLKGVTHPDDARRARDLGVAGLIVSNHGGRTLDTMAATADLLPELHAAVGDALPLIVDGGIRRGTDVLKALALGARAVLIGRPCVHALATSGALGVAHVIRLLRDELEIAMALTGTRSLDHLPPDLLAPPVAC